MCINDILLADHELAEFESVKEEIHSTFFIKDLGDLKFFPRLEVAQSSSGISIFHRKYCLELLEDLGISNSKPTSTPLDPTLTLSGDDNPSFGNVDDYIILIGKLI